MCTHAGSLVAGMGRSHSPILTKEILKDTTLGLGSMVSGFARGFQVTRPQAYCKCRTEEPRAPVLRPLFLHSCSRRNPEVQAARQPWNVPALSRCPDG